jgi:spore coat protein SA
MNIAVIAPGEIPVPPRVGGSVEHCIAEITKRLSTSNRVTVYSRRSPGYPASSRQGALSHVRVPGGGAGRYLGHVLGRMAGRSFDWIQIDNRPSYVPRVRSRFPGTRIAVFLHSTTFISPPRTTLTQAARQLAAADLVVANSKSLAAQIRSLFPGVRHKVKHTPLGVDVSQYKLPSASQRAAARREFGVSGSFSVLFAGRLIPKKGVPVLIRAMKLVCRSVPQAKLLVAGGAGNASYVRGLKQMAARYGVPARFAGYVSRKRMPRLYWAGDCFVCPSQGHEAFGLVNVEAMASGTPCVASANGGIREIVRHGTTGRLVARYRSPEAFAEQIQIVARDAKGSAAMAIRAREDVVRRFGWSSTAARLAGLYRQYRKRRN